MDQVIFKEDSSLVRHNGEIGHFVSATRTDATIDFLTDPTLPDASLDRRVIPLKEIEKVEELERGLRVWWKNTNEMWEVGQIETSNLNVSETCLVNKFITREGEATFHNLHESKLFVKSVSSGQRVMKWMTAGLFPEQLFFHNRRHKFIDSYTTLNEVAGGLTGIISSSVKLVPHQIAAARKVLLDPIRRYLLADEVGLGKTIEAGMILRQLALDKTGSNLLLLVPGHLKAQWEHELDTKFHLYGLNEVNVEIFTHDDVLSAKSAFESIDMLVIDEAHRLTAKEIDEKVYEVLEYLSTLSVGVLLLSATPVQSNELAFLRLLRLLDPEIYEVDAIDEFKKRIKSRDKVSDAVSNLVPDREGFRILTQLEILKDEFPRDEQLQRLIHETETAINDEDQTINQKVNTLKSYVSETYRLHQRMIRNRRTEKVLQQFPVKTRLKSAEWVLNDEGNEREEVMKLLSDFRTELLTYRESLDAVGLLKLVGSRCCSDISALRELHKALSKGDLDDFESDFDRELVLSMKGHQLSDFLEEQIKHILESYELSKSENEYSNRCSTAAKWAYSFAANRSKTVALCTSYSSVAESLYVTAKKICGPRRVAKVTRDMEINQIEEELTRARTSDCTVFICDSVAEEGLNLQFIDEVLHIDIPWESNRLEQRIGRFDRYDPQDPMNANAEIHPVLSTVFQDASSSGSLSMEWICLLDEGFEIFTRSSATLQYFLPDEEKRITEEVLDNGFRFIRENIEEINSKTNLTRDGIVAQDIFDSLDTTFEEEEFYRKVEETELDALKHSKRIHAWITKCLHIKKKGDDYSPWEYGRASGSTAPTLTFPEIQELGILNLYNQTYVAQRFETEKSRLSNALLFRPGQPLVDNLFNLARKDDRGITGATYKGITGVEQSPSVIFDLKIIIESDFSQWNSSLEVDLYTFKRICQQYLPTTSQEIWIHKNGECPPHIVETASQFNPDTDRDLSKNHDLFVKIKNELNWVEVCLNSESLAFDLLSKREKVIESFSEAKRRLNESIQKADAQHLARSEKNIYDKKKLFTNSELKNSIDLAISHPVFTVDSCKAVLIGPKEWL